MVKTVVIDFENMALLNNPIENGGPSEPYGAEKHLCLLVQPTQPNQKLLVQLVINKSVLFGDTPLNMEKTNKLATLRADTGNSVG